MIEKWIDWPASRKAAAGFAGLACLLSAAGLAGWVLGSPGLRSFGIVARPIFPLTAFGFLALSLGFVAAIAGRVTIARLFWAVPMLIAAISLYQNAVHVDIGIDMLFFRSQLDAYDFRHPGRPGATPTTLFLFLGLAATASSSRRWRRDPIASVIASGVLGTAAASAVVILFTTPDDPISQLYRISAPTALIALCLLAAFILWQRGFGWARFLGSQRPESRLLQMLLPAAILLPLIPAVLGAVLETTELLSRMGTRLTVIMSNVCLIGLIAYWAVRRVAHDQLVLHESVEALRASETRLSTATAVAELAIFEWDAKTRKLSWAPSTEERMGLKPGEMPDFDAWARLIEPEDMATSIRALDEAVARHADRFSYRYRFREQNGEARVVQGSSRIFYDDAGELARTVGVLINITEQEAREAALRGREAQLRSILDTVPDPMVVLDESGIIREFSAAAEALWGYRSAEVVGRDYRMLLPKQQFEREGRLAAFIERSRSAGGAPILSEGESAEGRRFPLELRVGVAHVEGKPLLTIFGRDISDRLASEERLSELSTQLTHVSRLSAMSELASDLAHELNQPLSAAANFLAAAQMLIERGEKVERIGELLGMANDQTLRAGEIIRRLRAFMARGEVEIRPESVEQTVRGAVELVLVGAGQFHIRVGYAFDPQAELMLADRIQVQQVLVNLLRNSVEALRNADPGSRQIMLQSRKVSGNMVEIEIADTGPGIPPPILERLFSRFTTTKSERGGMGIGLSISKRIIEAHGGELAVENKPGGGAVFRFTIPSAEEARG